MAQVVQLLIHQRVPFPEGLLHLPAQRSNRERCAACNIQHDWFADGSMIVEGRTGFYGLGDGTLTAVRDRNDILGSIRCCQIAPQTVRLQIPQDCIHDIVSLEARPDVVKHANKHVGPSPCL